MPKGKNTGSGVIEKWLACPSSSADSFWLSTVNAVNELNKTHDPERTPLVLRSRKLGCLKCLDIIRWSLEYFKDGLICSESSGRADDETILAGLESVVRLLTSLMQPTNPTLVDDLRDILLLPQILDNPVLGKGSLREASLMALRAYIDDRPLVVNAALRQRKRDEELYSSGSFRRRYAETNPRAQENGLVYRRARERSVFESPVATVDQFKEENDDWDVDETDAEEEEDNSNNIVSFIVHNGKRRMIGSELPEEMCKHTLLVLPGQTSEVHNPVTMDAVRTEHLLPNLVALLNAPWRARSRSWIVMGACPISRRLYGIDMNFDDEDSFRIGFDKNVLERIHPPPTASILDLHFISLGSQLDSTAESDEQASANETRRAVCERRQRIRQPTVIVVEVAKILVEDFFSYEDRDSGTNKQKFVYVSIRNGAVEVVNSVKDLRQLTCGHTATRRLRQELVHLEKEIAQLTAQRQQCQ